MIPGQSIMSQKLQFLRKKIDFIDNEILELLEKRQCAVKEVGELKVAKGDNCFIKPDREDSMLKNLCDRTKIVPRNLIISIWRSVISSSLVTEKEFTILILEGKTYAQALVDLNLYFSGQVEIKSFATALELEENFSERSHSVMAIPSFSKDIFKILASGENKIFAVIGGKKSKKDALYVIAQIKPQDLAVGDSFYVLRAESYEELGKVLHQNRGEVVVVEEHSDDKKYLIKVNGVDRGALLLMIGLPDSNIAYVGSSGLHASW